MPKDAHTTAKLAHLIDRCTCGRDPVVWRVEAGPTIRCLMCGRRTSNYLTAHDAALAWNLGRVVRS